MIKIFDATDTSFESNGNIAINPLKLNEVKKKSLNGWYIDVEIPIQYKEYIGQDKLCVVKTKSKLRPQAFRITNIEYSQRKISFTAEHVMFDARNYFLLDVRPTNLNGLNILKYINERTDKTSPFTILNSDVEIIDTCYFVRKNLLEAWEIIEERYGGIFDADNFDISFKTVIGVDRGEIIAYGKNLQNIKIYEDWSNVCTRIYPVGKDGLLLESRFVDSDIQYDIPYVKTISFETKLDIEEQTEENLLNELRQEATKYLEQNKVPLVSYEITSDINQLVEIGDKIHVKHPFVNLLTEVLEYEYNGISKKLKKIIFGNYTRNVKAKFDTIKKSIENVKAELSNQSKIVNEQTNLINSLNKNGHVYIDDNEILILDELPKENAKNVWRFGLGGLGFSSNGYKGPFDIAMTMDGKINADFISTGTLSATRIEGYKQLLLNVDKIVNLDREITNKNYIYIENAMQGPMLNLTIDGPLSLLFPSDDLYSSDDLYPLDSFLVIDKTKELSNDAIKVHLPLNYLEIGEKFIVENGKARIEKSDGTIEELENVDIQLFEGENYIYLESFQDSDIQLSVKYVIQNNYTDIFATRLEMNSSINQTAEEINSKVSKKISNDDGGTELASLIRQTAELIYLKANNFGWESDNSSMSTDGKITATAGKIGGFEINKTNLSSIIDTNLGFDLSNQEISSAIIKKVSNYISNNGTLTEEELKLYDLNDDGKVDKLDLLRIQSIAFGYTKIKGKISINATDAIKTLLFTDEAGNVVGYLGLNGFKTSSITSNYASITNELSVNNLVVNGNFTNNSDKRLKKEIIDLNDNYVNIIKKLNPVSYKYKQNQSEHIGFIAQDMEKVFNDNDMKAIPVHKDEFGMYSIDYFSLIGILWKDNQILHKEIDKLKELVKGA